MSSTNGTPFRIPTGAIGTEVARRAIGTHVLVRLVVPGTHPWGDRIEEHPLRDLVPVPSRYGGRTRRQSMNNQLSKAMKPLQDLTLPVPQDLMRADELMAHYGRWAQDRYKKQHCASAEGRYIAPPNDLDREPRPYILPAPDAMRIQRALQRVPELQRDVLCILYVPKRLPAEAQLRIRHIPPRICQERHRDGLRMFWNNWKRVGEQ